jgi:hypothetical protein
MPHFYFDTYDGENLHRDDIGIDLPDSAAAKAEAQNSLPDLAHYVLRRGKNGTFFVTVRNDAGEVIHRVPVSIVVEEGRGPG